MSFLAAFIDRQFIHNKPPLPTASFKGQTIIVTGASSGLGLEACKHLVRMGASQIILACRNIDKANTAVKTVQATTTCPSNVLKVWELDLNS